MFNLDVTNQPETTNKPSSGLIAAGNLGGLFLANSRGLAVVCRRIARSGRADSACAGVDQLRTVLRRQLG